MKDHTPHDPLNMVGEAYERLVEKTMANLHIKENKINKELPKTIRRLEYKNIIYPQMTNNDSDWHTFDKEFVKTTLLNMLSHAADQTTLELKQLHDLKRLPDEYHTGELVNAGTLYCDHCGMPYELELPNFLGKCENCDNTSFRTQH